jgi:hypothetical protein
VVFQEVPLHADVFGFLANQGVLGVSDSALIVFPYGGSSGDGGVKDLPHETEVESLLGGMCYTVVLRLAGGLRNACMLLRLVTDTPAAECEQVE